jgi:hypothetical protein
MVSMWTLYRTGTVLLTLSTLTTLTDSIRDGKSAQLTIYLHMGRRNNKDTG